MKDSDGGDGGHLHSTGHGYRDRIIESCAEGSARNKDPNVVIISRADARTRRIVNRQSLVDALQPYQPEVVTMSDWEFADQVSMVHAADVIIGAHGAGLTNCLWLDDGHVIEIFGDHATAHQLSVTQNLNLQYHPVTGVPVGRDIVVNPDDVCKILFQIFGDIVE
jgi:capsular polysaccharide biosynthesis protein